MCIIAASEFNTPIPTDEMFTTLWNKNPDGAGFMYYANGQVHIRKGFMHLKDFKKAVEETAKTVDLVKTSVVFHFRIGTHGGNIPENTHPFALSESKEVLRALEIDCDFGIAHNGIIHSVTPPKDMSDTMEYIRSVLCPMTDLDPCWYGKEAGQKLVENTIDGSRMCFMNGDGELTYIGTWHTDEKTGIKYSNTGYTAAYYTPKYTGYWDDKWDRYDYGWHSGWIWDDEKGTYFRAKDKDADCKLSDIDDDCENSILVNELYDGFIIDAETKDLMVEVAFAELEYFIDEVGNVYEYDYGVDELVLLEGMIAVDENGNEVIYSDELEELMPYDSEWSIPVSARSYAEV